MRIMPASITCNDFSWSKMPYLTQHMHANTELDESFVGGWASCCLCRSACLWAIGFFGLAPTSG